MARTDGEVRDRVARLDTAVAHVDAIPNPEARDTARAALEGVLDLYGEGLARIVGHVAATCDESTADQLARAMAEDDLVSLLLVLHGLHPDGLAVEGRAAKTKQPVAHRSPAPELVQLRRAGKSTVTKTMAATANVPAAENVPAPHTVVESGAFDQALHPAFGNREEQCELCAAMIVTDHRHMVDLSARRLVCVCGTCALLFDGRSAGERRYRLIPDEVRLLRDFDLSDAAWAEFAIPVDLAFFFFDTAADRIIGLYPGPMGAAESHLPLTAWESLVDRNPVLNELGHDTQAVLVNRTRNVREHWVVPVDVCYSLVGVMRTHWKGLGGGDEVWVALDHFFAGLRSRAVTRSVHGHDNRIMREAQHTEQMV